LGGNAVVLAKRVGKQTRHVSARITVQQIQVSSPSRHDADPHLLARIVRAIRLINVNSHQKVRMLVANFLDEYTARLPRLLAVSRSVAMCDRPQYQQHL
jgi:hypothetical protein